VNPAFDFAHQLLRAFVDAGVREVCVCPGSRSAPLAVAADATAGLRVFTHLDERSSGFFALGLARTTGRPAAVVCTSGSAAANLLPAVVEAHFARIPLLVLTADRPPELRDWGAGQTIDQLGLYGRHARWFVEVPVPDAGSAMQGYARALGTRAVRSASGRPAGAVHLNLPFREPLHPLGGEGSPPLRGEPRQLTGRTRRAPEAADVEALAARVRERCGVLVCGPMTRCDPELPDALVRLARACAWPLLTDALSGVRCGPHTKEAPIVSAYDGILRDAEQAASLAPQMVLRFGDTPTSKAMRLWIEAHPACELVLVDPDGAWQDPIHRAESALDADEVALCHELASALESGRPPRSTRAWLSRWQSADERAQAAIEAEIAEEPTLLEPRIVRELAGVIPSPGSLFVSNSMPVRDVDSFLPVSERSLRILGQRGANGIDGIVSSALGAAAGADAPLVLLTGDLALLHDLGGLLAARRHEVRATIVVLNNDGGGIFSYLPIARADVAFRELFATPHGLDLRWAARLFGLGYERASDPAGLRAALGAALGARRTTLVEVPIDNATSVDHHHRVWEAVSAGGGRT
jgi:2-succinyl-5-enolpyruvyl-6-hydroxy-3-cyclohexene-1-carboxylate synthase